MNGLAEIQAALVEWQAKGHLSLCACRVSTPRRNQIVLLQTGGRALLARVAAAGIGIVRCNPNVQLPEIARPVSWLELASVTPDELLSRVRDAAARAGTSLKIETAFSDPVGRYVVVVSRDAPQVSEQIRLALSVTLRSSIVLLPSPPNPSDLAQIPPDTSLSVATPSLAEGTWDMSTNVVVPASWKVELDTPLVKLMGNLGRDVPTPYGAATLVQISLLRRRATLKLSSGAQRQVALSDLLQV